MKTLTIIALCFSISKASGQFPSVGQIFNFEETDIFQYQDYTMGFPMQHQDSIVSKTIVTAENAVYYSIHRKVWQSTLVTDPTPHFEWTLNEYDVEESYSPLSALCVNFDPGFAFDTSYAEYNDLLVSSAIGFEYFSGEPPAQSHQLRYFSSGLGMIDNHISGGGTVFNSGARLVYYRTINKGEGGTPLLVNIPDQTALAVPSIFPNPANASVILQDMPQGKLNVFDLNGKSIHTENVFGSTQEINTSMWAEGIYLISCGNGTWNTPLVIKHE